MQPFRAFFTLCLAAWFIFPSAELFAQPETSRPGYLILKIKPAYRAFCSADTFVIAGLSNRIAELPGARLAKAFPRIGLPAQPLKLTGPPRADLSLIYYLQFDPQLPVARALRHLQSHPALAYAEPWYAMQTFYQPNDPAADTTGGLDLMWHLGQIKAREAWDLARGDSSILVGIVDSGTGDHPDLQANWGRNEDDPVDGIDNDQDGYLDNYLGWDFGGSRLGGLGDNDPNVGNTHGTWVVGIVGATADNGIGLPGICFNCDYLPIKGSPDDALGSIWFGYQGIVYAVQQGAQVVNCSWGGPTRSRFGEDVIQFATVNHQAAVVAACGNSTSDMAFYPAAYDRVISVANTSYGDTAFANTTYHFSVDVTAPGWQVYSTRGNTGYHRWGGTSAASPVVAGGVALVKAHFPQYSGYQAAQRLRITADDVYDENPSKLDKLGQGRINLYRALTDPAQPAIRQVNLSVNDVDGDGFFRAGDVLEIDPLFFNHLDGAKELEINLTLPEGLRLYAEVLDAERSVGPVAAGQSFRTFQPFRLLLKSNLPYDLPLFAKLTYRDDSTGYQDFEYVSFEVNPSYLNVSQNQLHTTVNSQGNLGWHDFVLNQQGQGVRYQNRSNVLFEAGLLLSYQDSVSDRLRSESGRDHDFRVVQPITRVATGARAPFEAHAAYDDLTRDEPIGLKVTQETFAFDRPEWNNFVLLSYEVENLNATPLDTVYAGLFADWDIAPQLTNDGVKTFNAASYDTTYQLAFAYDRRNSDLNYYGLALLSDQPFHSYALANRVDLPFNDSLKALALANAPTPATATVGEDSAGVDVLQFLSAPLYNLGAGQRDTVVVALLASGTYSGLTISRQEALRAYRCEVLGQGPQALFTWNLTDITVDDTLTFTDQNDGIIAWDWDFGDGFFGSGPNPQHAYGQSGTYDVTLRVDDGYCQSEITQTVTVNATTEIFENIPPGWRVHPNPTQGLLHLTGNGSPALLNLTLRDATGRQAWQTTWQHPGGEQELTLQLPPLPNGMYFLQVQTGQELRFQQRIVLMNQR